MKAINDSISCPVLRIAYDTLLGEWYDHDQHFDSPLLDQLRQIEEAHNGSNKHMWHNPRHLNRMQNANLRHWVYLLLAFRF